VGSTCARVGLATRLPTDHAMSSWLQPVCWHVLALLDPSSTGRYQLTCSRWRKQSTHAVVLSPAGVFSTMLLPTGPCLSAAFLGNPVWAAWRRYFRYLSAEHSTPVLHTACIQPLAVLCPAAARHKCWCCVLGVPCMGAHHSLHSRPALWVLTYRHVCCALAQVLCRL
jgi:hypothetical protein